LLDFFLLVDINGYGAPQKQLYKKVEKEGRFLLIICSILIWYYPNTVILNNNIQIGSL